MKRVFIACAIFCGAYLTSSAQFGVKGGLNFNTNGDLTEIASDLSQSIKDPKSKTGYHIGMFYQTKGDGFYLRPELVYTKTKSTYTLSTGKSDFDMSKIDAPILVGYHIIKPLSVFAGPSLQYILDSDLEGVNLNDVKNNFTVGINIGAAVQFNSFGVDVRYEKGLSENLANFAGISSDRIDTRPNQFIMSLFFKF